MAGGNSRRSSLSPSDRTNRRRDSPACIQVEIPPWHRAILTFIEVNSICLIGRVGILFIFLNVTSFLFLSLFPTGLAEIVSTGIRTKSQSLQRA